MFYFLQIKNTENKRKKEWHLEVIDDAIGPRGVGWPLSKCRRRCWTTSSSPFFVRPSAGQWPSGWESFPGGTGVGPDGVRPDAKTTHRYIHIELFKSNFEKERRKRPNFFLILDSFIWMTANFPTKFIVPFCINNVGLINYI